jgi:hypothetical protein
MKNIILYFIIAILASSCTKQRNRTLTIEGTLMANCSTPAANTSGYFHYTGGMTRYTWAEFTTDANGYFKVTEKIGGSNLTLNVGNGPGVLRNITLLGKDYLDLGKVYINPFPTNFIIKLDVKNPYTENDTLVIRDFSNPTSPSATHSIPGPFTSGILDSINDIWGQFPITFHDLMNHSGPGHSVRMIVRSTPEKEYINRWIDFYTAPICSGEYAEVTLVID